MYDDSHGWFDFSGYMYFWQSIWYEEDRYRKYMFRGRWRNVKNFYASLSIRGFYKTKLRIHASSSWHSRVCIDNEEIYLIAEDLEQRSRGSISLTADDCTVSIILVIFMLMIWYLMPCVEDYGWVLFTFWWWDWKSYHSKIRTDHAEIVADDLLMNIFRLHKLRRSTGSGGAAGWILMIALLAIWLLFLWSLWYSCSNDDNLVHGLLWWDFEP